MADDPYYSGDRNRKWNPNTTIGGAIPNAPDWQLCRVVSDQDDAFNARGVGVNASGFAQLRFAITPMQADPTTDPDAEPGGTADPAIEIRVWSSMARAFVPFAEPLVFSSAGAGEPYVIDVPNANGSIVGCFITNAITGVVAIAVQGHNDE